MNAAPNTIRPGTAVRLSCAAAAVATSGLTLAMVLGLFHQGASEPWLQPTPALLALLERCEALPDRAERLRCERKVVAARRETMSAGIVTAAAP